MQHSTEVKIGAICLLKSCGASAGTLTIKAAFHPYVNVYIYKPKNKSEIVCIVPWIFKSKHNSSTIRKK